MTVIPKSEVMNLIALAEYQSGGIVSRQITKTKGGNVTLFAFDQGQELSEHTAPYDALVHVLEGEGEFIIAGISHTLGNGDVIIMPADLPHAVRAVKRFKMVLTMIHT